jgi:(4S)-4-hydroxy-5-phosphonooxypentane-2,3-dione isomerase
MLIVHVNVRVKPQLIGPFIAATLENARLSLLETGVARFDVLQDKSKPDCFVLSEVYRSAEAPLEHKASAHYLKWRDTVAGMMAEPRSSIQFSNIFPEDEAF